MAKKGIFILITLCIALNVKSQSSDTTPQKSSSQELPTFSYAAPKKYVIAGIKVTGLINKSFDDYVIINYSRLSIGDTIEVPGQEITDAVKQFLKQGLFAEAGIYPDKVEGNKIWLEIRLKDNPRITDIRYEGMKKSEREDIEKKVSMVKGTQTTQNMIDRAKMVIKSYYDAKGFNKAVVTITQTPDSENENQIYLNIHVDKKERIGVNNIIFSGNHALSSVTLEKAMKKTRHKHGFKAKVRNFLRSTKFIPENYTEDKKNIISKYNEKGYRDAKIEWDSVYSVSEKRVNIEMKIDEGDKYYIRNITWVGNTKFKSENMQKALDMYSGNVYDQKKLNKRLTEDEDAVKNIFYYNQGYIFASVDPIETNIENDSVDLEIRIIEGIQATINKVNITGNDRVYEDVVRRELRTKPGAIFSREELMRSLREVAQMGHFDPEHLQPDVIPNGESGTVDITYPLVSKANDQVELSAGWGQTGIIGRVSLKFTNFSIKNLFNLGSYKGIIPQGEGQTLTISGQTNGRYYQSYSISFMDPWFGGKRPNMFSVGTYVSYQTDMSSYYNKYYGSGINSYSNYYNNYYSSTTSSSTSDKHIMMAGASVSYGKRLNWPDDYFTFQGQLSYQLYSMKNWDYFIVQDGNCNSLSFNLTLSRSSIDQPIYTRSGSQFSLGLEFTPPYSLVDGKDYKSMQKVNTYYESAKKYELIEYYKWSFKSKTFHPLFYSSTNTKTPVLMTRAEFGFLGYYNQYKKSPFGTYYMGGDGMTGTSSTYATETVGLRGYENGSIATNASAYTRLGVELRYPVMLEPSSTIYLLSFIDAGNAWTSLKDTNPFQLKRSAGIGVRIMLPMVGLMGIDWGYGFDKIYSNGSWDRSGGRFNFIIGQEF